MSKGKRREREMATSNSGKRQDAWEKAVAREFGRLKRCSQKVTARFLAEANDPEELHLRESVATIVQSLLNIASQGAAELPIFEETREAVNWDIYISGFRGLLRDHLRSYVLTALLPLIGAKELGEKWSSLAQEGLELLRLAEIVFRELDRSIDARVRAREITAAYGVENEDLEALYASLKTWETDEELQKFTEDFADLLDKTVEVIVEGPIQLYLMISREGFILIFKGLMSTKVGDPEFEDQDLFRLMALHNEVRAKVEQSAAIKLFQEFVEALFDEYLESWKKRQKRLRGLFPTQALRDSFVQRFERGVILRPE